MGYHVEVVDQMFEAHRTTMLERLLRNLAPWMLISLLVALIGCSASQSSTPSIPEPPKPPSEPSATSEAPTPTPLGGTGTAPTAEAGAAAESKESDGEAGREGAESGSDGEGEGEESETESEEGGETEATPSGPPPGAPTSDERRAGLESELDESLREFDGLILKEQELLEGRREAAAAGGGGGGGGAENAGAGSGEDELESRRSAQMAGGTGGSSDAPEEPPTSEGDARVESAPGEDERYIPPVPEDVGDGRDDDIVAKQIREAAMTEKDPVLREKLWAEYRAYKSATKD